MSGVHLDLDGALGASPAGLPDVDARSWGPRLRYLARPADIERFRERFGERLAPFVVYGSGDFHHLTALLAGRLHEPLVLVCFDNHPDWDRRPPRWACGAWVNRALALPQVRAVSVWGCGNHELRPPHRLFAPRAALRSGRLEVRGWRARLGRWADTGSGALEGATWRSQLEGFCAGLGGARVYVSVDLDCLRDGAATTSWEPGLFTPDDLRWALSVLHRATRVVGGDICGAWSPGTYERPFQRLAARWDHPRLPPREPPAARTLNRAAVAALWPALTGG